MAQQNNSYGKVIKISNEDYKELHELKFDLRKDTFGEVISELLREHRSSREVPL